MWKIHNCEFKEQFVPSILITQKSEKAAEGFQKLIRDWGYDVAILTERDTILDTIKTVRPDVIIVGATADEPSSLKLSRDLREKPFNIDIPSLLIASDFEEGDVAVVVEKTANDCLVSPFSIDDLRVKLEALMPPQVDKPEREIFEYAGLVLNARSYRVTRDGVPLHLTPKCYRILKRLLEQPTHVVSREVLMSEIWGMKANVDKRTVDVHIKRLRTALNKGDAVNILRTVRGAGYSIDINSL